MKGYETLPVEHCGACKHFRRHYTRSKDGYYYPLSYGHCVYPMLKKRRGEEHCAHWSAAEEEMPAVPENFFPGIDKTNDS